MMKHVCLAIGLVTLPAAASNWYYLADEVGIAAEVVGDDLVPTEMVGPNRTVRIWAVMPAGWRLDAIAGNDAQSMFFSTDAAFYQDPFGGATSLFIEPGLFPLVPECQWDSFLTIGATDNDGSGAPGGENNLNDIGIDFSQFELGADISAANGSVFILPSDLQGETTTFTDACGREGMGVLIGQFTLIGAEASITGSLLMQGRDDAGETWQRHMDSFTVGPDGLSDATPPVACAGDINSDDSVDIWDLLELLDRFSMGACADITGDVQINAEDFLYMLQTWGPCSAP